MIQAKEEKLESPIRWKVPSFKAQDPLIEVNIRTKNKLRITKVNGLLAEKNKSQLF